MTFQQIFIPHNFTEKNRLFYQVVWSSWERKYFKSLTWDRHLIDSCLVIVNVIGWKGGACTCSFKLCQSHFFFLAPFLSRRTPKNGFKTSLKMKRNIKKKTIRDGSMFACQLRSSVTEFLSYFAHCQIERSLKK